MKLNKALESKLLENIFADYSLVTKGESNNGAFYTVKKGDEIRHIKIVDKQQEDEEGLDETALSELTRGSRYVARLIEAGDLNEHYSYLVFEYIAGKDLSKVSKLDHDQLKKLSNSKLPARFATYGKKEWFTVILNPAISCWAMTATSTWLI